ncbi:carboxypeptidase regulatory-like domain-containing protein [Acidiluteibacter ferrifornacis]|uniref:Carboxypeptidase regulatory-like domain-containing protein n=1 Tax=Acidiluteibacter ferrifornacis TaxID=2692424 RepID=A0A6N9NHT9_9FLAO|nr:carboxypeptidase regulatory-like domain-containing protein [Acidiluteibacter ferrifornacis]NBG65402.1 hypothetical protein [Acidiluteibacter ferrifornacis]
MKSTLLSIFILLMNFGFCQVSEDLQFILKGKVVDQEISIPIQNARVEVIGTDSSTIVIETNENGVFETPLKGNTSYSVSVSKSSYLNAHGKETTIDETESNVFFHLYELEPMITIHEGFTTIDFNSTFSFKSIDFNTDSITLYKKYDGLSDEEVKYKLLSESNNDYQIISQQDVTIERIRMELIDTSVVKISTDKFNSNYWLIGYSTKNRFWFDLIKW